MLKYFKTTVCPPLHCRRLLLMAHYNLRIKKNILAISNKQGCFRRGVLSRIVSPILCIYKIRLLHCLFINKEILESFLFCMYRGSFIVFYLALPLHNSDRPNIWFGRTVRPNFYCLVRPK
jgi:hypothetical protein